MSHPMYPEQLGSSRQERLENLNEINRQLLLDMPIVIILDTQCGGYVLKCLNSYKATIVIL